MKVYLVLNEFGWGTTLNGIFDTREKAEIVRDKVIKDFSIDLFNYAEKSIKESIEQHEQWIKTDKYLGRKITRERADWFDYTLEQYVKEFIIKIKEVEFNEIINLIIDME